MYLSPYPFCCGIRIWYDFPYPGISVYVPNPLDYQGPEDVRLHVNRTSYDGIFWYDSEWFSHYDWSDGRTEISNSKSDAESLKIVEAFFYEKVKPDYRMVLASIAKEQIEHLSPLFEKLGMVKLSSVDNYHEHDRIELWAHNPGMNDRKLNIPIVGSFS